MLRFQSHVDSALPCTFIYSIISIDRIAQGRVYNNRVRRTQAFQEASARGHYFNKPNHKGEDARNPNATTRNRKRASNRPRLASGQRQHLSKPNHKGKAARNPNEKLPETAKNLPTSLGPQYFNKPNHKGKAARNPNEKLPVYAKELSVTPKKLPTNLRKFSQLPKMAFPAPGLSKSPSRGPSDPSDRFLKGKLA